MGISQGFMLSQQDQLPEQVPVFSVDNELLAGLYIPDTVPNYANIYPGTQNFCWEIWMKQTSSLNQPLLIVSMGTDLSFSPFALTMSTNQFGDPRELSFNFKLTSTNSTVLQVLPFSMFTEWFHLALCRIGSTINIYAAGILVSQMTGVTTDITLANIGTDGGLFSFTGPVGDRDQTYPNALGLEWRNMRYTIGNSVYPNAATITPPPFAVNLAPVTGTQFIWWPNENTVLPADSNVPYTPDYTNANFWDFYFIKGDTTNVYLNNMLYADPLDQAVLPLFNLGGGPKGSWSNNGGPPSNPKLTTSGPPALYGTTTGDFSASGTNVRISSADSAFANFGASFLMYIWFYMPASIVNEPKSIITVSTTDGLVLTLGRPGQGIDWLSLSTFGGSEQAYAPKIWARNAWNFLCVQKDFLGAPGPVSAWAGAGDDTFAKNLNIIDSGASVMQFAGAGTVSIGCAPGSTVSCQLYFNQILGFQSSYTGGGRGGQAAIYEPTAAVIPIIAIPTINYRDQTIGFDFQGTNGQTNIQPGYPT